MIANWIPVNSKTENGIKSDVEFGDLDTMHSFFQLPEEKVAILQLGPIMNARAAPMLKVISAIENITHEEKLIPCIQELI
jgi:hypothetical protein